MYYCCHESLEIEFRNRFINEIQIVLAILIQGGSSLLQKVQNQSDFIPVSNTFNSLIHFSGVLMEWMDISTIEPILKSLSDVSKSFIGDFMNRHYVLTFLKSLKNRGFHHFNSHSIENLIQMILSKKMTLQMYEDCTAILSELPSLSISTQPDLICNDNDEENVTLVPISQLWMESLSLNSSSSSTKGILDSIQHLNEYLNQSCSNIPLNLPLKELEKLEKSLSKHLQSHSNHLNKQEWMQT